MTFVMTWTLIYFEVVLNFLQHGGGGVLLANAHESSSGRGPKANAWHLEPTFLWGIRSWREVEVE